MDHLKRCTYDMLLQGLPSDSFYLDEASMRICPVPHRRTRGRTTHCVEKVLDAFSQAGTCYIRLEALTRCAREEGKGQVLLAFVHVSS